MILFPDLLSLPHQLRHPEVRDLAWVILTPPMLEVTPWPQRHPLAGSDWVQAPERLEAWLRQLDRDSYDLLHWLAQARTRRLGLYYERLWQYAVRHAPGIELIAANLPIRREGHTLGELDMLLRDGDGVHHLELAIKLYLGPQDGNGHDPARWLGPGCHDRLDRKLTHLSQHQLPIANRPESREVLAALGIGEFSSHLWLGVTCCIRGRGSPTHRLAPILNTCVAAGCIRKTGPSFPPGARSVDGSPCPATPGWRRHIIRRSRRGMPNNSKRGSANWNRWLRRSCWCGWSRIRRVTGKKRSVCSWWRIFGRMCLESASLRPPVGASLLAMVAQPPRAFRRPASSLTTIGSRLAPTRSCFHRIYCGSEPARDRANPIQKLKRTASATNVTSNTGSVNTIPTLK